MNLALIDLGSNSARMYLLRQEKDGTFSCFARRRVMTRLREGMQDGVLALEAMERTLGVLKQFSQEIQESKASVLAIATAAVRSAKNGNDFAGRVLDETGIRLFIISGNQEAALGLEGVLAGLPNFSDGIIFDTGGGSTEIILAQNGTALDKISLPFGAMSIAETYFQSQTNSVTALERAKKELSDALAQVPFLSKATGLPLVGIGGSVCALGHLAHHLHPDQFPSEIHGVSFSPQQVKDYFRILFPLSPDQRQALGVEAGRADTICAGLLPTLLLFDCLSAPQLTLCTWGLREGLLAHLSKGDLRQHLAEPELFLKQFV